MVKLESCRCCAVRGDGDCCWIATVENLERRWLRRVVGNEKRCWVATLVLRDGGGEESDLNSGLRWRRRFIAAVAGLQRRGSARGGCDVTVNSCVIAVRRVVRRWV